MSELGERYKQATEQVLHKYDTEMDSLGRSQKWKLDAIKKDRESCRDSSILTVFAEGVEQ